MKLKKHARNQAVGPHPGCPIPGGNDRFVVWSDGNYWCRQCDAKGYWLEKPPDQAEIERRKKEKEKTLGQLYERMHRCTDWITYNRDGRAVAEWERHGFRREEVEEWGLGFCPSCPVVPTQPSLTIPVFQKGKLYDIRHRLLEPSAPMRYCSHIPGLQPALFNLDAVRPGEPVYVVEGEKKAILVKRAGLVAIGVPGIGFYKKLNKLVNQVFPPEQEVIFLPDPGTTETIVQLSQEMKRARLYIVELWAKPDDFILEYGVDRFLRAIEMRRPL